MKSKMFRFTVLSVFLFISTVSFVYSHELEGLTYNVAVSHSHGGTCYHTHANAVARDLQGPEPGHDHRSQAYKDLHSGSSWHTPTCDSTENEPEPDRNPHSHTSPAHQHGNYVSHTHSKSHSHDIPAPTPGHTHGHPHAISNNHDRVDIVDGERPTTTPTNNGNPTGGTPTGGTPTVTTPIVEGGGPAPTVEGSETPEDTSTDSGTPEDTLAVFETNIISPPQETQPEAPPAPPLQPIRVTEYMVRDWAGVGGLPQWIELYNPNTEDVNLKGYTFQYATRQLANDPYKIHTLKLAEMEDGFSIAGGGVVILATQKPRDVVVSGIEISSQVYNLSIQNVLKRGWVLIDADGEEIQRLGRKAFSALSDPVAPPHQGEARVSHSVLPSETPSEPYYYGHSDDVGSPGFYEEPAPAAPSAVIRKTVGTWASLKRM